MSKYPTQVEVEFEWTLEASEEGEEDKVLTITATGDVGLPDREVGYNNAYIEYTSFEATDENGAVVELKGHSHETVENLATDKLNEKLANGDY
jgi:hypothetical protein